MILWGRLIFFGNLFNFRSPVFPTENPTALDRLLFYDGAMSVGTGTDYRLPVCREHCYWAALVLCLLYIFGLQKGLAPTRRSSTSPQDGTTQRQTCLRASKRGQSCKLQVILNRSDKH